MIKLTKKSITNYTKYGMKNLTTVLAQEPVFLNDWKGSTKYDILEDFLNNDEKEVPVQTSKKYAKKYENIKILFASCSRSIEPRERHGWILFEQDGKLFEVSRVFRVLRDYKYYGNTAVGASVLAAKTSAAKKGQWNPLEVNLKELAYRIESRGHGLDSPVDGTDHFASELKEFLGIKTPYKYNYTKIDAKEVWDLNPFEEVKTRIKEVIIGGERSWFYPQYLGYFGFKWRYCKRGDEMHNKWIFTNIVFDTIEEAQKYLEDFKHDNKSKDIEAITYATHK